MNSSPEIKLHSSCAASAPARRFVRSACRLPHFMLAASALLICIPAAEAGEVSVKLWGATLPYDPAIKLPSGSVSGILNRDLNTWSWRNYAAAAMGGLVISARESLSANNGAGVHQAVSTIAYWLDDITIDSPGLTGQSGVMTITYRVNGYVIFTGTYDQVPGYNSARLIHRVEMNGAQVELLYYEISQVGVSQGSDFLNADRTIQLGFTFGTPFTLKHQLSTNTALDSRNGTGRAWVEAAGLWKGITVKYQDAPLASFTASSSNVPNWSQPLPRPVPALISTVQTGELVFTWPEQAVCDLVASPDLASWLPSTAAATVSGMLKTVRVPMSGPRGFFQLQPTP